MPAERGSDESEGVAFGEIAMGDRVTFIPAVVSSGGTVNGRIVRFDDQWK